MALLPELDVRWLVAFVNEYAGAARETAGEQDNPHPSLHELVGAEVPPPSLPDLDLPALVAAADEIHPVFGPDGLGALNRILDRTRPWPRTVGGGVRWMVEDADDVLPAALAVTLLEWVGRHGVDRLGCCDAARCIDVYADTSSAGRRRFCSSICLNRHKVAEHRKRASQRVGSDARGGRVR